MADNIVVIKEPETTVVISDGNDVVIASPGPAGPPGPQGQPGASAASYTQSFANTNFVSVTHNLGFYPNVEVIVGMTPILATVTYLDLNTLTVGWNSALLTGEVVCS